MVIYIFALKVKIGIKLPTSNFTQCIKVMVVVITVKKSNIPIKMSDVSDFL